MFDEARLDDVEGLERLDTRDTLRSLASSGASVRRALQLSADAGLERLSGLEPRGVVVAAAGGSAGVAELFEAVARSGGAIPVQSCTSMPLPGWVGAIDLVIAVSQSGRAAGPLALAAEAARRGAMLLTIGAPDSPLAELSARSRGIHVPLAMPESSSRTAMWAHATPLLLAADALGLATISASTVQALADVLDERAEEAGPSVAAVENPAKTLATDIAESSAIVLGSGPLGAVAAGRAVAMFGRTGRVPVASGVLPDAASQIVACFDGPLAGGESTGQDDIFADPYLDGPRRPPLRLVMLRHASEAGTDLQILGDTVVAAAEDAGVRVSLVDAVSDDPLLRVASHVATTDFAATYLAFGQGFDPATSPHVRLLRDARTG
ncbi:SIS domain-containing protein [Intrasporangium sp.]|uniref:SIS domain-containing protein n=1 Tax=Intrasporangium sp. TaxID=1925024 RepID=UPI00293A8512|nr:SIS domain-containing protein [Intrasporangium sp.]MDV3220032.1 phosphosugar isomerase [Intrasporangium sp.]